MEWIIVGMLFGCVIAGLAILNVLAGAQDQIRTTNSRLDTLVNYRHFEILSVLRDIDASLAHLAQRKRTDNVSNTTITEYGAVTAQIKKATDACEEF